MGDDAYDYQRRGLIKHAKILRAQIDAQAEKIKGLVEETNTRALEMERIHRHNEVLKQRTRELEALFRERSSEVRFLRGECDRLSGKADEFRGLLLSVSAAHLFTLVGLLNHPYARSQILNYVGLAIQQGVDPLSYIDQLGHAAIQAEESPWDLGFQMAVTAHQQAAGLLEQHQQSNRTTMISVAAPGGGSGGGAPTITAPHPPFHAFPIGGSGGGAPPITAPPPFHAFTVGGSGGGAPITAPPPVQGISAVVQDQGWAAPLFIPAHNHVRMPFSYLAAGVPAFQIHHTPPGLYLPSQRDGPYIT